MRCSSICSAVSAPPGRRGHRATRARDDHLHPAAHAAAVLDVVPGLGAVEGRDALDGRAARPCRPCPSPRSGAACRARTSVSVMVPSMSRCPIDAAERPFGAHAPSRRRACRRRAPSSPAPTHLRRRDPARTACVPTGACRMVDQVRQQHGACDHDEAFSLRNSRGCSPCTAPCTLTLHSVSELLRAPWRFRR